MSQTLTGKRWQELLHEKIFVPLAMTSTWDERHFERVRVTPSAQ